ncbi:hypothetical protein D3C78_828250 [compost metagenome]
MVLKYLALFVDGTDEQVGLLQGLDHRSAVVTRSNCIAQRRGELLEYASLQQKLAAGFVQPGQDIFGQVLGQRRRRAAEGTDERRCIVVALQGQRSQIQAREPTAGSLVKPGYLILTQRQLPQLAQVLAGLLQVQLQRLAVDFQQLPLRAQTSEIERRSYARGHAQGDIGRQPFEQLLDEVEHLGVIDCFELIEQQREGALAVGNLFDQGMLRLARISRQRIAGNQSQFTQAAVQGRQQTRQVVVGCVERAPQGWFACCQAARLVLGKQGGLAGTGAGTDQQQAQARLRRVGQQRRALQLTRQERRHKEFARTNWQHYSLHWFVGTTLKTFHASYLWLSSGRYRPSYYQRLRALPESRFEP